MVTSAGIACTADQVLDVRLTVICNTCNFEIALDEWENKPNVDKTWDNFKTHLKNAQQQLKKVRGPTVQQAGCHHANHLATQLQKDLDQRNNKMFSISQSTMETASTSSTTDPSDLSSQSPPHQANAMHTDPVQLKMLKLSQQMQQTLANNGNNDNNHNNNPNPQNRNTNPNRRRHQTPDNATYPRRITDKYCWTHGGCNHSSADCTFKAPGHQDAATFAQHMGGSNVHCAPAAS